ncbi:unnamed protein product [Arctia plantaginis]|uniref:OTU domain-containing protein n=1 Tax=Arctia plantaginis TaxID=874455 RepID=A0A8S0ZDH9_ARCPL|nr:unnamed protein product [Arctia plantaginis]CAB3250173.1 unnamed protein product [Arctia plantaginis]
MESEADIINTLEVKHRKEKKELQAQIQAMKKTAKNDKTKKKELAAEITRLEIELDARHKYETESIKKETIPTDSLPVLENESSIHKVSKAQKRRDKKSQQEKEREEQIKLQEQENLHGPRNTEQQAINVRLKEKGLKGFPIPSDGDCLYKAVAHQMAVVKNKQISVNDLRLSVADYIRKNKDDFIPFMSNPDTLDMLTDDEFEEYCNKIENTKVWGGQLEIRALSNCLKHPISVIQATGPDSIEQGTEYDGPPLVISYHRHMYRLGEHYNSTVPNTIDEND